MAVVTAVAADGNPAGMVVGTFSSVSLDPPLIAFFPTRNSGSFAHLRTARTFCVTVLASDQEPLCRRLATGGAGKFDGVAWRPGPCGSPVLDSAVSWIECEFEDVREAGDHDIVLGRVREFAVERSTLPLLEPPGPDRRCPRLGRLTATWTHTVGRQRRQAAICVHVAMI